MPNSFRVRPIGNYIHVRLDSSLGDTTLALPESAKKASLEVNPVGEVLAIGPGMYVDGGNRYPIDVKVGDRVQLLRAVAPVVRNRQVVPDEVLCDHSQILAVLEPLTPEEQLAHDLEAAKDGDVVPVPNGSKLVLVP